jgi:hypothetical protein
MSRIPDIKRFLTFAILVAALGVTLFVLATQGPSAALAQSGSGPQGPPVNPIKTPTPVKPPTSSMRVGTGDQRPGDSHSSDLVFWLSMADLVVFRAFL